MKRFLKPILIIIALLLMLFAIYQLRKDVLPNEKGIVTIEYVDINKTVKKSKDIKFNEESKLIELIENNFDNVLVEHYEFGPFIIGIEDYIMPNNFETTLLIYVNDEYSMVGISSIELIDGMTISLRVE